MKVKFITLLFFVSLTPIQAQETDTTSRSRFSIFTGLSLPTGKYASTTTMSDGFARAGFGGGFEFSYEYVKSFDIGILCDISVNSIDIAQLEKMWSTYLSDVSGRRIGVSIETSHWLTFDLMASVGFNAPISKIFKFYGKGYLGNLIGIYPETDMMIEGLLDYSYLLIQEEDVYISIGFGFSLGVIIKERIDCGLLFTSGEPEYRLKRYVEGEPGYPSFVKEKKPTSRFLLRVGVIIF